MATPRTLAPALREGLELRCAALTLGGTNGCLWNESPPPTRALLPRMGEQATRQAERAGFAAWLDAAVVPGSTRASRHRATLAGVRGAAGGLPEDLGLLEPARLDGTGFRSPREWAEAEWRLVWEEAAQVLAHQWEEDLDAVLADGAAEVYVLVGRERPELDPWERDVAALVGDTGRTGPDLDWGSDANLESAAAVVTALQHRVLTPDEARKTSGWARDHVRRLMQNGEPEVLVRAPGCVAAWLEGALFTELCVTLAPAEPGDGDRVAEVGLALWEPEGRGALREPRAAFGAARDVLATA